MSATQHDNEQPNTACAQPLEGKTRLFMECAGTPCLGDKWVLTFAAWQVFSPLSP